MPDFRHSVYFLRYSEHKRRLALELSGKWLTQSVSEVGMISGLLGAAISSGFSVCGTVKPCQRKTDPGIYLLRLSRLTVRMLKAEQENSRDDGNDTGGLPV